MERVDLFEAVAATEGISNVLFESNTRGKIDRRCEMIKTAALVIGLLLYVNVTVFAAAEQVISTDNEYGGITTQVIYAAGDPNFKRGIYRITASYDGNGIKKRMAVYSTPDHSEKKGWYKRVIYYWGRKRVSEAYSTDSDSAKYGFYKMVSYFDSNNKLDRREYYLNEGSLAAKRGVYKRVVYYDKRGRETNVEDLDRVGNVVLID